MPDIRVVPARKGMGLSHPVDGPLADDGGVWREDQFTLRRLRDRDIRRVKDEADESETDDAVAKPSAQPAPAKAPPPKTAKE